MQLLMAPASPFVRKVRVLIRETGQESAVEEVNVTTTPLASDPAVVAANPTGKIPALMRDDGPAIYDSRVITRFLDARAGAGLYPEARLWEVLTLEATADALMDAAVLVVYEQRFRSADMQSPEWLAGQRAKITRALDAIEGRWMSHLSGPLDAAHIAVGVALSYLDFRGPVGEWREGRATLAAWHEAFAARPSMQATLPG